MFPHLPTVFVDSQDQYDHHGHQEREDKEDHEDVSGEVRLVWRRGGLETMNLV